MSRSHRKHNFPPATLRPVNSPLVYFTPPPVVPHYQSRPPAVHRPRRSRPVIPPEVIAEIVGCIWDESTLLACEQTARAFYHPARENLFYKVYIAFPSRSRFPQKTPLSLHMKVKKYPYLTQLIRGLVVNLGMDHRDSGEEVYFAGDDERQRIALVKAIARLPRLQALQFPQYQRQNNDAKKWTSTPFFPALPQPQAWNIRELNVAALKGQQFVPFHLLAMLLPNLKRLTVDLKDTHPDEAAHMEGGFPKRPLETLEIVGMSDIKDSTTLILGPTFPFDIAQTLRTLVFDQSDQNLIQLENYQNPRDLTDLTHLLRTCRNLTEFTFGPCPCAEYSFRSAELIFPFSPLASPPDISGLFIKKLVLEGVMCEGHDRLVPGRRQQYSTAASPLRWVIDLLQTVNPWAPIHLQEVKLHFVVGFHSCKELLELLYAQWDELCRVLMSARFPRLRKVHIRIVANPLGIRTDYYRRPDNHPALEKMRRAGLLQYEFTPF